MVEAAAAKQSHSPLTRRSEQSRSQENGAQNEMWHCPTELTFASQTNAACPSVCHIHSTSLLVVAHTAEPVLPTYQPALPSVRAAPFL